MPELGENNIHKIATLLVWDCSEPPPSGDWITVLWSGFEEANDPTVISVLKLVEEHADTFKARYLAWIHELGETHINGKRLIDHLELRPGFSYWWMTSLAQKFNASGISQIDNAIKALALEGLVAKHKPEAIILVSGNDKIASTLQSFCKSSGLRFEWNLTKLPKKPEPVARLIYGSLPAPMQALIYFFWHLFKNLLVLRTKQIAPPALSGEISFVDVLVHLDRRAFTTGKFISNYWTALVDRLLQSNAKINWLHNYCYQESIPSLVRAQELIGHFNKSSGEMQTHALIETNLSSSVFIKALKDYFQICKTSFHLSAVNRHFLPAGSALNLWPLFRQEWIDSLRGQGAMVNCLCFSLYEKTFNSIPCQKLGIYIQENQPWEMALIHAWKAASHGKLIGVPHTTVRFWDLRYFYDSRSYVRTGKNVLPMPDLVAVNGPVAKRAYLEGGYPESRVTEVEALRFLHLLNRAQADTPIKPPSKALNVLVCGDFLSATNYKLLSWLAIATRSLPPETTYVLRPHPAYPVNLGDFPSLALKLTDTHLAEMLADCDVVFTSNITSVAVDAYCSGIPVIQMRDGNTFNTSPLRGLTGVVYVTNPMELAEALRTATRRECRVAEPYFYLDEELPRWRRLLDLSDISRSTIRPDHTRHLTVKHRMSSTSKTCPHCKR